MSHTYYVVYEHIIFSTKERRPFLDESIRDEVFRYLASAVNNNACHCIEAGGYADHIHLLVQKTPQVLTPDLVRDIKRTSSKWLKSKGSGFVGFAWQAGYSAFSVSFSQVSAVKTYITRQAAHHKTFSFADEFRAFLDKQQVPYDDKYFLG